MIGEAVVVHIHYSEVATGYLRDNGPHIIGRYIRVLGTVPNDEPIVKLVWVYLEELVAPLLGLQTVVLGDSTAVGTEGRPK